MDRWIDGYYIQITDNEGKIHVSPHKDHDVMSVFCYYLSPRYIFCIQIIHVIDGWMHQNVARVMWIFFLNLNLYSSCTL